MEFTIGEVAAMVGVSPHTIRAWERRHHVLKPHRTASRQRRYTPDDVELLLQVRRRVSAQGLSLKIAVRAAQGVLSVPSDDSFLPPSRTEGVRRSRAGHPPSAADQGSDAPGPGEPPWRAVADLLPLAIVVLDGRGAIVEANRAAARMLGEPLEKLAGRPFRGWLDSGAPGRGAAPWRAPFARDRDRVLRLKTAAGEVELHCDLLPFMHRGEQSLAVIATAPARLPVTR